MGKIPEKPSQKATVWQKIKQPFIDAFDDIFSDDFAQLSDIVENTPYYKRLKAFEKSKYRPSKVEFYNYMRGGMRMSEWGRKYHKYLALRKLGKIDKDWEAVVAYYQGDSYKKPLTQNQMYGKVAARKAAGVALSIELANAPLKQTPRKVVSQPAHVWKIPQNTR